MIVAKLMGGMGNQMFQYAMARALSLKQQASLKLDTQFLLDRTSPRPENFVYRDYDLDIFNLEVDFATEADVSSLKKRIHSSKWVDRLVRKILIQQPSYYTERHFHFDPDVLELNAPVYLEGYWQSEKYFANYAAQIRQDFQFKEPIQAHALPILQAIQKDTSICVNVRRGDFVTNPVHGTMGASYYQKAAAHLEGLGINGTYYVFSDDIEWCQENMQYLKGAEFVGHTYAGPKFRDYLELMRSCKHFIIPNSSFGWWAAWLSEHPQKQVIAPQKWFGAGKADTRDIFPMGWKAL
jgi:hypothetical protein